MSLIIAKSQPTHLFYKANIVNNMTNIMLNQKGIKKVVPFIPNSHQYIISIDIWFDHNWNNEITPILTQLKVLNKYKIESIKIAFNIKNIHIKLKRKAII